MDDGGELQRLKRIFWQTLARADGGGVGVDLQKVVDVVLVSVREEDHLLHGFCDGHKNSSLRYGIRALRRGQEPVDVIRGVRDGAARGVDGEVLEENGGNVAALTKALIEVVTVAVVGERLIAEVQHDAVVQSAVAHGAVDGEERREVKVAGQADFPVIEVKIAGLQRLPVLGQLHRLERQLEAEGVEGVHNLRRRLDTLIARRADDHRAGDGDRVAER